MPLYLGMKKALQIIIFLTIFQLTNAQSGGENIFEFLNTPSSARLAALGGAQAGLADSDINLIFNNPATLNDTMSTHLAFTMAPYVADITAGAFAYAHHFKIIGTFALGMKYLNYGTFDRTDENGAEMGTFKASDYAFLITWSRPFGPNWQGAMTAKPVISHLESYRSFGFTLDAGVIYRSNNGLFTAGAVLHNLGTQITTYHDDDNTYTLKPNLQAGLTYKPEHAPFRFSFTMQDITNWNQYDTKVLNSDGKYTSEKTDNIAKKLIRHAVIGVEFIPVRNFYVAAGYNHARRTELKGSVKAGSSGWSWGTGFRVYKFHFAYGSARYHVGGRTNYFSLSTNISSFR